MNYFLIITIVIKTRIRKCPHIAFTYISMSQN